jgi:hypothetical protein
MSDLARRPRDGFRKTDSGGKVVFLGGDLQNSSVHELPFTRIANTDGEPLSMTLSGNRS